MKKAVCALALLILLCGCNSAQQVEAPANADSSEEKGSALTLTAEEKTRAGIVTTAAQAAEARQQITGYGLILSHDSVAQAVADVLQSEAIARQSKAAFDRARRLAGTPGAISSDQQESAARQATVDETAAMLANQKLSALIGPTPPWRNATERARTLQAIASGATKLLRVTFSWNDPGVTLPATFHLSRINRDTGASQWQSDTVWPAPADTTVPGRSYFALLHIPEIMEGERLIVRAASGASTRGFLIPASAAVLYEGRSWFYLEHPGGGFARVELDPQQQIEGGYIASSGVVPADRIVTSGAGLLLARETGTPESD